MTASAQVPENDDGGLRNTTDPQGRAVLASNETEGTMAMAPDTSDDPLRKLSRWDRIAAFIVRITDRALDAIRGPSLSDRLPPLPPAQAASSSAASHGEAGWDERGELLLLEILRSPEAYQRAAIDVARYSVALRDLGEDAYAEGLVHFVLSRMRQGRDGTIPITRLRDILCNMPFSGVLVPALRRLEGHGIVHLMWAPADASHAVHAQLDRIELRIQL